MIHKGKTSKWPQNAINIVERNFGYLPINVYIGQSMNAKCSIRRDAFFTYDIVMIYSHTYEKYVAWNPSFHQGLHAGENVEVSVPKSKVRSSNEVNYITQKLSSTNGVEGGSELVTIIPKECIYQFCSSIEQYLEKCMQEKSSPPFIDDEVRKVDMISKKRRDPKFRHRILNLYGYKCVICGESTEVALEAAHIVAVKDDGSDCTENGVCLCANHHRMFDAGLLNIDFDNRTFSFIDEFTSTASWYLEVEDRKFKFVE